MSIWSNNGYTVEYTQDGSPTLKGVTENMHHSGGAASETKYIYGKSLEWIYQENLSPRVLIIGLGLGYIEILTVYFHILQRRNGNPADLEMTSYESDPFLVRSFLEFLLGAATEESNQVYSGVLNALVPPEDQLAVRAELSELRKKGRWTIQGALKKPFLDLNSYSSKNKYNVIQYDAYSSKTSEELWQEEFLISFIEAHAESNSVFATYACVGSLKRALAKSNFLNETRAGFQGKRDSTFAYRKTKS
ncbi:MAG: MnmC family methyltransferase [Bdellovibrionota bacterium]